MSIETRLKRIEGVAGKTTNRIIQVWLEKGQSDAEAIKKWEIANNTKVKPNEQVILIAFIGRNNEYRNNIGNSNEN